MATFLFDKIVFGPVVSRRLGQSLGINLLPLNRKVCNFNCLYCECGLNGELGDKNSKLPSRKQVSNSLELVLKNAGKTGKRIDTITFAGNGEPTMHPDFCDIVEDTLRLRKKFLPSAKIAVLSNATLIGSNKVFKALSKIEYNILKLDSAFEDTLKKINCPQDGFSFEKLINNLSKFRSGLTIQTLFIRGTYHGYKFDNTSTKEINAWLDVLHKLRPDLVMVYSISRDTPIQSIEKIDNEELERIAKKVKKLGLNVSVSG